MNHADNKKAPENILDLPDAQVGETETDDVPLVPEPKHVSFDPTLEQQQLNEGHSLVEDIIDNILPKDEIDNESEPHEVIITEQPTSTSHLRYNDEQQSTLQLLDRYTRILQLLDRYTQNLESIEEHVRSRENIDRPENSTDLQLTQQCELSTQTQPANSLRLNVTSTIRPKSSFRSNNQQQHQRQQQQHFEDIPPCESRYHTITISTHSSAAYAAPQRPTTVLGRMWRTVGDFAGACCLCLQVNKDCVFCLGFFIAFVISASFLTAFFYRTMKLAHTTMRPPVQTEVRHRHVDTTTQASLVTLRLNGGYYYVFNNHQQRIV